MNMPGMIMHSASEVQRTGTGQYRAKFKPGIVGDWMAKLSFDVRKAKDRSPSP
jgi:hypothetical protein